MSRKIQDLNAFKKIVEKKPDRSSEEIAKDWGDITDSTIRRYLRSMNFTYKKTFGYKNRCEIKRDIFQKKISDKYEKEIIYLDECGVKHNETCQYGWGHKSSRLYGLKEGSQYNAVNIIGSLNSKGELIAPFVFEGTCDAEVFNTYIKFVLSPYLNENVVV
ncbi:MAG: transposase, partial [Oligoflexales bacterium]